MPIKQLSPEPSGAMQPARARVGRPPAATRDQVIAAALEIGLGDFTVKGIAAHLGVSIPTVYQVAGGYDDIARLAFVRLLDILPYPVDRGQHWAVYLREYAATTLELLIREPHNFVRFVQAGFMLEAEIQVFERFLQTLVPKGFTPTEAFTVLNRTIAAVMGAAAAMERERMTCLRNGSVEKAIDEVLAHHEADELPIFRQTPVTYLNSGRLIDEMMDAVILHIAWTRGEHVGVPPAF